MIEEIKKICISSIIRRSVLQKQIEIKTKFAQITFHESYNLRIFNFNKKKNQYLWPRDLNVFRKKKNIGFRTISIKISPDVAIVCSVFRFVLARDT